HISTPSLHDALPISLNSANGTCALSHLGSRVISSIDARVLLQIKYIPSPSTTNASKPVPIPCRANSKSPMLYLVSSSADRNEPKIGRAHVRTPVTVK